MESRLRRGTAVVFALVLGSAFGYAVADNVVRPPIDTGGIFIEALSYACLTLLGSIANGVAAAFLSRASQWKAYWALQLGLIVATILLL